MAFELPALPYANDALEPHMDARTMEIHHSKHHNGYTTNLNNAIAGTDLEGKGWLLGFGAQYRIDSEWAIQGAVDLVGKYSLDKKPSGNQDDDLSKPLSLRLKGQYFFAEQWTADLSTNYIKWGKFEVPGASYNDSVTQWMVGVGITYHFGNLNNTPKPQPVVHKKIQNDSQEKVSILLDSKKTDTGFKLNLPSVAFGPYKVNLSKEFASKIKEAGLILAKYPNQKIRVEGHTDTSGNETQNISLSKARAESVRRALIQSGVNPSSISSNGFGSKNPIATNQTAEGRAKNRRVELFVDQK